MAITGMHFVITGVLSRVRAEYDRIITSNGGYVDNSVSSRRTNYVIVGRNPGNTKLRAARDAFIPRISEQGFMDLLHNGATPTPLSDQEIAQLSIPEVIPVTTVAARASTSVRTTVVTPERETPRVTDSPLADFFGALRINND